MQKQIYVGVLLLFITLLTFFPRLFSLSAHWSSDESVWIERSHTFFSSLQTGHFANTFITHHPGVTTTWLGGISIWNASGKKPLFNVNPESRAFLSPSLLARVRFPVTYLTGLLILLAGVLLYRLFNGPLAAVGTLFLAVEPFLLAESRRIHTDALTSGFLFLTLLLWLCYLESDTRRRRDLVFSGICFAFACLTKSLAGAFLLFLPILLAWYVKQRGLSWVKMLWSALLFCCLSFLTALMIWPYLWTLKLRHILISPLLFIGGVALLIWAWKKLSDPRYLSLNKTDLFILGSGILGMIGVLLYVANSVLAGMYDALTVAHELPKLFLGDIRYDTGILYYPVMWFVWSSPLMLPLIGAVTYLVWKQRHTDRKGFRIAVVLVLFTLFYLIGLSLLAKKIARYLVIFLPVLCLLATIGAFKLSQFFPGKRWVSLFLVSVVFLQVAPVLRLHPYYQTYYFPLLSGKWVAENASSITGVGLDLAADYLNTKPNAPDLQVRVTRFSKYLEKYFGGTTWRRRDLTAPLGQLLKINYDVEYLRDKQLQGTPLDLHPADGVPHAELQFDEDLPCQLEHVVRLNGIDYVWIYRVLDKEAP